MVQHDDVVVPQQAEEARLHGQVGDAPLEHPAVPRLGRAQVLHRVPRRLTATSAAARLTHSREEMAGETEGGGAAIVGAATADAGAGVPTRKP
jgi:hypothetical protein